MIIDLPYKVDMSVNHQYLHVKNIKILTPAARFLRARIITDVKQIENKLPEDTTLSVYIELWENWIGKNGNMRKSDLDNRLKFLIDSIFRGLGMDDKLVFEIHAFKKQSEENERTLLIIKPRYDEDVY